MTTAYVSATYEDLREFRDAVSRSLRRLGVDDIAMESYVAEARRPVERCLEDAGRCDLYIGIFAWRYGFIPPGYNKSIFELEYEAATAAGRPRLIFLLRDDTPWPRVFFDRDAERIEALRYRLSAEHLCSFFTTPEDLGGQVTAAVTRFGLEEPPSRTAGGLSAEARNRYLEKIRQRYARLDLAALTPLYVVEEFDVGLMSAFTEPAVYIEGVEKR